MPCPPGFTDHGLFCKKPTSAEYGRGVGKVMRPQGCRSGYKNTGLLCTRCTGKWPWQWKCDTYAQDLKCDAGLEEWGGLCYKPCQPRNGFSTHNFGCCICTPDCPPDEYVEEWELFTQGGVPMQRAKSQRVSWKDIGVSCAKPQKPCPAGMPYKCGLACTPDAAGCDKMILQNFANVFSVVVELAMFYFTGGLANLSWRAAKQGVMKGVTAARIASKVSKFRGARFELAFAQKLAKQTVKSIGKNFKDFVADQLTCVPDLTNAVTAVESVVTNPCIEALATYYAIWADYQETVGKDPKFSSLYRDLVKIASQSSYFAGSSVQDPVSGRWHDDSEFFQEAMVDLVQQEAKSWDDFSGEMIALAENLEPTGVWALVEGFINPSCDEVPKFPEIRSNGRDCTRLGVLEAKLQDEDLEGALGLLE